MARAIKPKITSIAAVAGVTAALLISATAFAKSETERKIEMVERQFTTAIQTNQLGMAAMDTVVIHNSGKTVSIDRFYEKNPNAKTPEEKQQAIQKVKADIAKGMKAPSNEIKQAMAKGHFPVVPEEIQLSTIHRQNTLRDIPNLQFNLFIIGNDKYSLAWLKENKSELLRFKAAGIITKVDSREEYQEIVKLAQPLTLMPVSGDFATQKFGTNFYPVLITSKGEFR